jgi:hypothetical protein
MGAINSLAHRPVRLQPGTIRAAVDFLPGLLPLQIDADGEGERSDETAGNGEHEGT